MTTKSRRAEMIKTLLLYESPYKEKIPEHTVVEFVDSMVFDEDVITEMHYKLISDLLSPPEFEKFLVAIGVPLEHFDETKDLGYGKDYKRVDLFVEVSAVNYKCAPAGGFYCYKPGGDFA